MFTTLAGLFGVLTLGLLSPGPDFVLILRNSLGPSAARGLGTVAGITVGLAAQVTAITLGLAALPPPAMRGLQLLGAVYLAWLGLRALLARSNPTAEGTPPVVAVPGARSGFVDGLVCNLTNPKAFLFFVGLFSQVAPAGAPLRWRAGLAAAIVVHGALLWTLVVLALRSPAIARRLARLQHWLPRAFGLLLVVLSLWLVANSLRG